MDAALSDFANVASQENRQLLSDTVSGPAVDGRNRLVQLAQVQQGEQAVEGLHRLLERVAHRFVDAARRRGDVAEAT
ncbi:hypothetical protein K7G98_41585, partial [Saccharothrix sp. MB29]|nr:hypothetical protein [Saccharothrix sp. MB29]